jgi:hypothetical protein
MTSPHDETTAYAFVGSFPEARPAPSPEQGDATAAFGPDEERLVQMARQEAVLRLARAL